MFAITGASGQLGQLVARQLIEAVGPEKVRLGSRDPGKVEAQGAQVVAAGYEDAEALKTLFKDAEAVLVISGGQPEQHEVAFKAAIEAGAKRIVYTSAAGASPDSRFVMGPLHYRTEQILKGLPIAHTILRNNMYSENIAVEAARATGALAQPAITAKLAHIARADCAAAAVAALTGSGIEGGLENRTLEITGPEAISAEGIAAALARAWGKEIKAVEISRAEYVAGLEGAGLPPFAAELIASIADAAAAGEYETVSADFEALVGRKPLAVSEFLAKA